MLCLFFLSFVFLNSSFLIFQILLPLLLNMLLQLFLLLSFLLISHLLLNLLNLQLAQLVLLLVEVFLPLQFHVALPLDLFFLLPSLVFIHRDLSLKSLLSETFQLLKLLKPLGGFSHLFPAQVCVVKFLHCA